MFAAWRRQLGAGCAVAAMLLTGCSNLSDMLGMKAGEELAQLPDIQSQAGVKVRWHQDLDGAEINRLHPAFVSDAVFAVSELGELTRMNSRSGQIIWQKQLPVMVSGGVGASEQIVVVGSNKGQVLAYDHQGNRLWQSTVSSEVLNAPQIVDDRVVVRTADNRITALSAQDGTRQWQYNQRTPSLVVRSHAGVTIQRGVVYAGFAGGKLLALRLQDGQEIWQTTVSLPRGNTELERISDITSAPVVDPVQVCAVAFQGELACYDISDGRPLWKRQISSDKGMMLYKDNLYLTDTIGNIMALDKNSGSTVWKNDRLAERGVSIPFVIEDFLVVGDAGGFLHVLDRRDGALVGRLDLQGGQIHAQAQRMHEGLLVQTMDGDVYSIMVH